MYTFFPNLSAYYFISIMWAIVKHNLVQTRGHQANIVTHLCKENKYRLSVDGVCGETLDLLLW